MTITTGTQVLLRNCPHGEPGQVVGTSHGRVLVEWSDLGLTARHKAESLIAIEPTDKGEHIECPTAH